MTSRLSDEEELQALLNAWDGTVELHERLAMVLLDLFTVRRGEWGTYEFAS